MAFSLLETITFHLAAAQTCGSRAQAGLRGGAPLVEQARGRPRPLDVFSGQPAGSSRRRARKRERRSRNRRSREREVILPVGDAPPSPPPTLHRSATIGANMADLAHRFVARLDPTTKSRLPPRRTFECASDSEPEDPRPQPNDESTTHNDRDNTIAIDGVAEPVADGANQPTATPDRARSVNHRPYSPANTVPVYMTGPPHPLGPGTSTISTSLRDEAAARAQDARRAERHVQFCVAPPTVGSNVHEKPHGGIASQEQEPVAPTTYETPQVVIAPQEPEPPTPNVFWPFTPLPTHKIDRASLMGVPNFSDNSIRFPDDFKHISYNRQEAVAGRRRPCGGAWGPVVREAGEMIGYIDELWDGRAPLPPTLQQRIREPADIAQSLGSSRCMALAFRPSTLNNTDASVAVDAAALPTAAQENVPRSILVSTSAGPSMRDGVNIRRPSVHFDDVDDYSAPPAENASHNDQAIEDEEEQELELSDSGDDDVGDDEEETTEEPEEDDAELAQEVPVAGSMAVPAPSVRPHPGSDGGENAPMLIEGSVPGPSIADAAATVLPSFRNNSTALGMAQARLTQTGNGTYSSTFRDPNVSRFLRTVQSGGQVIHNASYFNRPPRLNMTRRGPAPEPIAATDTVAAPDQNIASTAGPLSSANREHRPIAGQDSVVPRDPNAVAAAPGAPGDDDGDSSDDTKHGGDNEDVPVPNMEQDDVSPQPKKAEAALPENDDAKKYPDAWSSSFEEEDDAIVQRNMMQEKKRRSTILAQRPIMDARFEAELY